MTDDEIYESLHADWLKWQGIVTDTPIGQNIIATHIRAIESLQRAMIIMREGEHPIPREPE